MTPLYPIRFRPLYKRAIWGGRRFEEVLQRKLGPGNDFAESWEICDHDDDQSLVDSGPLAGTTLHELVIGRGKDLLGRHHPQPRFPLLLKYLDANQRLSVQVHPDDATAARMHLHDSGKTEAWVVLSADPQSTIWAGFIEAAEPATLRAAISGGYLEQYLHRFEPEVGQCIFLPARTIHALGDGLMVVEIQQSSDLTFRLYDWNRVGPDGKSRPLHIEQGLEAIDYTQGPVEPRQPLATSKPHVQRLVECTEFVLDRWQLHSPQRAGGDGRCHILSVLAGVLAIDGDPSSRPLGLGDSALLPASAGEVLVGPCAGTSAIMLDAYLP